MAKGQKKSSREAKKPKASAKKPATTTSEYQLPARSTPGKNSGK